METAAASPKKKATKDIMSRNVTQFRHLLSKSYINENDLNWTINLRSSNTPIKLANKQSNPPQVYFKKTQIVTLRDQLRKKNDLKSHFNSNDYDHCLLKKNQKTQLKHTHDQLTFYADLRKNHSVQTQQLTKAEKAFDTIPFKERKEFPKLLKKECMKKMRSINNNDQQVALDGDHKQNPYSQKILRNKNYGFLQSFTKIRGRGQVSLPGLAWQIGLRNYR